MWSRVLWQPNPQREASPQREETEEEIREYEKRLAAKRKFSELVWGEFERAGIVVLRTRLFPNMRVSLTRSTYPGVLYQVTRWEGDEPTGHLDARSKESALNEMWEWAGGKEWRSRWRSRQKVR